MTLEKRPVVVPCEEAGLLALGATGRRQPGGRRFGARLRLRLRPEREPHAPEEARVEPGEHVALILLRVRRACEQKAPLAVDDLRVVARREAPRADAAREREQLGEAEAAVAADARVRRL